MDIAKILDESIKDDEIRHNTNLTAGYNVGNGKEYDNYISKVCWEKFKKDMELNHKEAFDMFGKGGGKELEERKSGRNTYPPKMASFGSSSRMIYNLSKHIDDFKFEKKLYTTVGGVANLDGFLEKDDRYIFVEAKCREPYGNKSKIIGWPYEELYKYITKSDISMLKCDIETTDENKMSVEFSYAEKKLMHFDIKQMICHLLGIATSFLQGEKEIKAIDFYYLLFNPHKIEIANKRGQELIYNIYDQVCEECNAIDFKKLFLVILQYLHNEKNVGEEKLIEEIYNNFNFYFCDQDNYLI